MFQWLFNQDFYPDFLWKPNNLGKFWASKYLNNFATIQNIQTTKLLGSQEKLKVLEKKRVF